jgi:hypothetical protein
MSRTQYAKVDDHSDGPSAEYVEWHQSSRSAILPEITIEGGQFTLADDLNYPMARVAIAIDPVALINTECIMVTSAMRKHARWAHSSVSAILGGGSSSSYRQLSYPGIVKASPEGLRRQLNGVGRKGAPSWSDDESLLGRWGIRGKKRKSMEENPLMSAFARLRSDLRGCKGMMDTGHLSNAN